MKKNSTSSYSQSKRASMTSWVSSASEDQPHKQPSHNPLNSYSFKNYSHKHNDNLSSNASGSYSKKKRNSNAMGEHVNESKQIPDDQFIKDLNNYINQFKHHVSAGNTIHNSPDTSTMLKTSTVEDDYEEEEQGGLVTVPYNYLQKVLMDIEEERFHNKKLMSKIFSLGQDLNRRDEELMRLRKAVNKLIGVNEGRTEYLSSQNSPLKENDVNSQNLQYHKPTRKNSMGRATKYQNHALQSNQKQKRQSLSKYSIKEFLRLNSETLNNSSSLLQQQPRDLGMLNSETVDLRHLKGKRNALAEGGQLPVEELQHFISKSMGLRQQKYGTFV